MSSNYDYSHDDALLHSLLHTVERQKHIAIDISNETSEQLKLLDHIDSKTNSSTHSIKHTSNLIHTIHIKSSTKCMWLLIFLLFLILIILLFA